MRAISLTMALSRLPAVLMAAVLAMSACLAAGESDLDAYRQALARTETLSGEIEAAVRTLDRPPPLPDCAERLLSINRNAVVAVGGEFRTNYTYSRSDGFYPGVPDPQTSALARSEFRGGDLSLTRARLNIDVLATDRVRARLDIDLTGRHTANEIRRTVNVGGRYVHCRDDDYVRAAYVEFLKAGHSGFGFKVGKFELPFGLGLDWDLPLQSFMDAPDLTGSYLASPFAWSEGLRLPHASGLLDPVVAAMVSYELRDIVRFEAAVFQDEEGRRRHGYPGETREWRVDSSPPRSFQIGASILPLEGWELSLAFRNRYSRSRGVHYWADSPFRTDFLDNLASGDNDPLWDPALGQWSDAGTGAAFGSVRNEQAFSLGLAVEIPNTNLSVRAEYAHGWNQGFNKHVRSDGVNLGFAYRATPFLTLHAQGEWLYVKDRSWLTAHGANPAVWVRDTRNNHLYRLLLGAEYELARGVTVEGGWQYEYWRYQSASGGEDGGKFARSLGASTFYLGTKFAF